jgi:hypothetical protein
VCFSVGVWVCVFGISIISSHHPAWHHIIHHIAPMTRVEYQVNFRRMLCKKWKCAKAQSKLRNTVSSTMLQKKGSLVHEPWMFLWSMDIFMKHGCFYEVWIFSWSTDLFLYEAWKEGKVFFRRRLKNGMYIKFHASQRSDNNNNNKAFCPKHVGVG